MVNGLTISVTLFGILLSWPLECHLEMAWVPDGPWYEVDEKLYKNVLGQNDMLIPELVSGQVFRMTDQFVISAQWTAPEIERKPTYYEVCLGNESGQYTRFFNVTNGLGYARNTSDPGVEYRIDIPAPIGPPYFLAVRSVFVIPTMTEQGPVLVLDHKSPYCLTELFYPPGSTQCIELEQQFIEDPWHGMRDATNADFYYTDSIFFRPGM